MYKDNAYLDFLKNVMEPYRQSVNYKDAIEFREEIGNQIMCTWLEESGLI